MEKRNFKQPLCIEGDEVMSSLNWSPCLLSTGFKTWGSLTLWCHILLSRKNSFCLFIFKSVRIWAK